MEEPFGSEGVKAERRISVPPEKQGFREEHTRPAARVQGELVRKLGCVWEMDQLLSQMRTQARETIAAKEAWSFS